MDTNINLHDLIIDLNTSDKLIRDVAYNQLIELGSEAVPTLVEMFPAIVGSARLHIVRAFGEIGSEAASGLLVELIISHDLNEVLFVTSMAAKSLGRIGDVGALVSLLDAEHHAPRRMAATVLKNMSHPDSVPALGEALRDPDPKVRAISHEALTRIGSPEALAALQNATS